MTGFHFRTATTLLAVPMAIALTVIAPDTASALGGKYQVSHFAYVVRVNDGYSGVLVAPTKILTAAHCHQTGNGKCSGVSAVEWTLVGGQDLSVITLSRPLALPTIPLARSRPKVGVSGTLIGYGMSATEKDGTRRQVTVTVTKYDSGAGWVDGDVRACGGDSGGALVVEGQLAGVTLDGDPFCTGQYHDTGFVVVADSYLELQGAISTE